jgi:hypothetical protein
MAFRREIKRWLKLVRVPLFLREGAFFCSFMIRIRGFHGLLWEKPSSLFMLSGWSSVSVASLITHSIHPEFLARLLLPSNWMWWFKFMLCSATADWSRWEKGAPWSWSHWHAKYVQCRASHTIRGCYKSPVFSIWGHPWWAKGNCWPS